MKLKKGEVLITKNGSVYRIQIWVEKLSSWLVYDNFKTRKLAKAFLADKKEINEIKLFIARQIKKQRNENDNNKIETTKCK